MSFSGDDSQTPICPDHDVPMRLRGKMGRPARYDSTLQEEYTLVYFCSVHGCGESKLVQVSNSQIPAPGFQQPRPDYIRPREKRS
ncbi:MAG: hypothetical protein IT334_05600 [Thermomicrobiales bacterium]|nr:hypothetical protein [Thermomicrobiales bacterium]